MTTTNLDASAAGLLAARLKALINRLRFFRGDCYFLVLFAQLLMHEGDRVIPRRQALDFIFPALVRVPIERTLHHIDVHLSRWVLVSLDRQHDFLAGKILFDRWRRWWLRFVPLAVVFRRGMNVVRGLIIILD